MNTANVPPDVSGREASVLGAVLQEPSEAIKEPAIAELLAGAPESFLDLRHGKIAASAYTASQNGGIEIKNVVRHLKEDLNIIGGLPYLAHLMSSDLPVALASAEAGLLIESYQARRLQRTLSKALSSIESSPAKADEIREELRLNLEKSHPAPLTDWRRSL